MGSSATLNLSMRRWHSITNTHRALIIAWSHDDALMCLAASTIMYAKRFSMAIGNICANCVRMRVRIRMVRMRDYAL